MGKMVALESLVDNIAKHDIEVSEAAALLLCKNVT